MSTRQLRKLQKQRELEETQILAEKSSGESDKENEPVAPKPRVSLFAALGGDDDDEAHDEDEEQQQPDEDVTEIKQPSTSGKSKKKKNKKKKSKAKAAAPEEDEDEIDKAMRELNIKASTPANTSTSENTAAQTRRINELLSINPYHLKANNEMRNLFGRDVIESAAAEEEQERNRRPMQREIDLETFLRGPPGAPKLPEVSLRRNVFIQGREHWPKQSAGGLTMKEVAKAEDGSYTEYAYTHDQSYNALQAFFFTCVQIGDPQRMIILLKEAPYHVSTLLQVSSIAKQDQNQALAAELCERALFTFGRVTTNAFRQNIEQGKARLDFRRPENRQFWLAGYHYLKSLVRKGTNRTALEWAKLMYSLDPSDPYAMRHFIHWLAIRAHESQWLIDFVEELEKTTDNRDSVYLRQTLVLAHLQLGNTARATEELEKGMRRVPWLYCGLFQELNLDTPPSIWGINADSNSRSFWVKLYIHQAKDIWNNAQAIPLLEKIAKSLEKVDTSVLPSSDSPPDQGVTRLVYLEGQTSLMGLAPREYLEMQPNYEFDPLPPPEEENIFSSEGTRMPFAKQQRGQQSAAETRINNMFERLAAAAQGHAPGGDEDDEEGAHRAAVQALDDEELMRDLEEHERGGDAPGFFERMMHLLSITPEPNANNHNIPDEADDDQEHEHEHGPDQDEDQERGPNGGLPGAWPESQ
ncbi:transcription factor 25 [Fusarium pseudocircinatum]|uniref:Transcription factor 25 n=1 Tax=Fusarium pseudocircinatum TaxID=56676 RepID=A0A8H5P6A5_9HYPO|nr:transcription factor 25 [Fusarium pseudocircinatum]